MYYSKRVEIAIVDFIEQDQNIYAVTFAFNKDNISHSSARNIVGHFHAIVDRKCLGRSFHKRRAQERLRLYVKPENEESNFHYHGHIQIRNRDVERFGSVDAVIEFYEKSWKRVCPSGSLKVKPIFEANGWAKYISKSERPDRGSNDLYWFDLIKR